MKPEVGTTLQIFYNLTGFAQTLPLKDVTTLLFSSEDGRYDGERGSASDPIQLLPFECMAFGPSD